MRVEAADRKAGGSWRLIDDGFRRFTPEARAILEQQFKIGPFT
jgi:hypothetical protein